MNMKKMIFFALAGVMSLGLAACSGENVKTTSGDSIPPASSQTASGPQNKERPESVTIISLNASKEETELEVPYDPQRIAILDMASLDILDALGVGGRVVGTADTSLEYLQNYINDDISSLGTIKEADLEAVMACEPDVIFIGGRLASSYDAVGVILAHNHPSGDCLPSREDIITTRMAAEALGKIDVTLVDHVIVAGDDCVSMATSHVLPEVFPDVEERKPIRKVADRKKKKT